MALNDLLAALEARKCVTPETPRNLHKVSVNAAPFKACTLDTPDTPVDAPTRQIASDLAQEFAALEVVGIKLSGAIDADAACRASMLADWTETASERWPQFVGHLDELALKHATSPPLELVKCGNCRHFFQDGIGDGTGIGTCQIEAPASQDLRKRPLYPQASRPCRDFDVRA